jgi:hypothetical protein
LVVPGTPDLGFEAFLDVISVLPGDTEEHRMDLSKRPLLMTILFHLEILLDIDTCGVLWG